MEETMRPFLNHLALSRELITPHEETRAGFLHFAIEKNSQAIPYISEARALKVAASKAHKAMDLLDIKGIDSALLTAAGLSKKARGHLTLEDKKDLLVEWIKNVLEPEGNKFVDELVYRFLLTKGDALGGRMRNLAGKIGERKFTLALISALRLRSIPFFWIASGKSRWIESKPDDMNIDPKINGLSWVQNNKSRTALYNRKVLLVNKNIDFVLLDSEYRESLLSILKPEKFIALGELKCGIDPAGADEHWKTANSALGRVRDSFSKRNCSPALFFIGAAIEQAMSVEIFNQLGQGKLTNAANLTNADQLHSICQWIIEL
jgi:hypothetical protein